jgi:hypothetical protein
VVLFEVMFENDYYLSYALRIYAYTNIYVCNSVRGEECLPPPMDFWSEIEIGKMPCH